MFEGSKESYCCCVEKLKFQESCEHASFEILLVILGLVTRFRLSCFQKRKVCADCNVVTSTKMTDSQ